MFLWWSECEPKPTPQEMELQSIILENVVWERGVGLVVIPGCFMLKSEVGLLSAQKMWGKVEVVPVLVAAIEQPRV